MHTAATFRWQRIAVASVVVLVAAFVGGVPAGAQERDRPDTWIRALIAACPTGGVPQSGFEDGWDEPNCLVWYGITSGVTATKYKPFRDVTRGQMATFVANMIDVVAEGGETRPLPEYDGANQFPDAADSVHVTNINRLADAGIVQGGPGGAAASSYGPRLVVRRGQMATFLNGAQEYMTGAAFQSANDFFVDDERSVHERNINAIAEHGITGGRWSADAAPHYAPRRPVERGNMAAFIMRLIDVHVTQRHLLTPGASDPERSNESFGFDETVDTAQVSTTAVTNEGATQFRVSSVAEQPVTLAVFACADVWDTAGVVTFRDAGEPTGQADLTVDDEGAVIEQVNGSPRLERDNYVAGVEPSEGEVTFTVDSTTADCGVGVAFADANANGALDVDDAGAPTEPFAASTPLLFVPDAAADGAFEGTVIHVDRVGGNVIAQTGGEAAMYAFDDLDTFLVDGEPSSLAEFFARVTFGDTLAAGAYATDGETTFELTDAAPQPPAVTAATLQMTASDDGPDPDIHLEWEPSATPTVDGYRVSRAHNYCDHDPGWPDPRTIAVLDVVTAYTDADPTIRLPSSDIANCYRYHVRAIDGRDESGDSDASTAVVRVESDGPFVEDTRVVRDGGRAGVLDPGDHHRFAFSRRMSDDIAAPRSTYRLDAGNDEEPIRCKVTGPDDDPETTDCVLNQSEVTVDGRSFGPGQVLTVRIGTDRSDLREKAIRYPVKVSEASWNSARGNNDGIDLESSPDRTLNVE